MDGRGSHPGSPAAGRRSRIFAAACLAAVCSAVLLVQCLWVGKNSSLVVDETPYLASALQTRHDGALDPRLVRAGVAPLPILIEYVPALWMTGRAEARPALWVGKTQDAASIAGPRLLTTLFAGVPLVIAVFVWLYRRRGLPAATLGALLLALSPSVVAHAAIATTDATFALWSTLSVLALAAYMARPTLSRLGLSSLVIGIAIAAKYSGVYLIGCAALLIAAGAAWSARGSNRLEAIRRGLARASGHFTLLLAVSFAACWAVHGFVVTGPLSETSYAEMKDSALAIRVLGRGDLARHIVDFAHTHLPEPAPLRGLLFQVSHNRGGQEAFLAGETSTRGWWYFFPLVFLFKSTPVELGLTALLIVLAAAVFTTPRSWREIDPSVLTIGVCASAYAALLLTSHIDIGNRFLLPLYPLIVLAGCDRLFRLRVRTAELLWLSAVILAGAQAVSGLSIAPHSLSYFNALAGGSRNGWRLLVDSSFDWGQDLPALARTLDASGGGTTAIKYFGSALPIAYGVDAEAIEDLTRPPDQYRRLAISATHLQGLYMKGGDAFSSFRNLPPSAVAGYSIFLYDLDSEERKTAFREAVATLKSSGRR